MYNPRHAVKRVVGSLTWSMRSAIIGAVAASATLGGFMLGGIAAASTASICTGKCSLQQIAVPSGYNLDVQAQSAEAGNPIIVWKAATGDPAQDFTVQATGIGDSYQIKYTPFTNLAGARSANNTAAEAAYASDGTPKYCVSAVSDQSGVQAQLRDCATSANPWQDFLAVVTSGSDHHAMFEPTYGQAGVSAGSHPMALNDSGYGKNHSPIIDWPASGSWNEQFWPGAVGAAAPAPSPSTSAIGEVDINNHAGGSNYGT
jgi:hypothetical protein